MSYQTDLVRRLRGQYGIGPASPNGEPEMGYRQFDRLPPIHGEAATEIERLRERVAELEASNASKHTVMLASARALAAAERDAARYRHLRSLKGLTVTFRDYVRFKTPSGNKLIEVRIIGEYDLDAALDAMQPHAGGEGEHNG